MEKTNAFNHSYIPWAIKWGRGLNILCVLTFFLPMLYLGISLNLWPQLAPVLAGLIAVASFAGHNWITMALQWFPILGVGGTYISGISGNVSNMLVPCAIAAQKAADVDLGTPEAEIIASLSTAVSTILNLVVLSFGVMFGSAILAGAPPEVNHALGFLLPAILAACTILVAWNMIRILPIALAVQFFIRYIVIPVAPALSNFLVLITILITIVISLTLYKKKIYIR